MGYNESIMDAPFRFNIESVEPAVLMTGYAFARHVSPPAGAVVCFRYHRSCNGVAFNILLMLYLETNYTNITNRA